MAGFAGTSVPELLRCRGAAICACIGLSVSLIVVPAAAESLYKYRGEDGEWIFSDRPPDDDSQVEVRALQPAGNPGELSVAYGFEGQSVVISANNRYYAPVEVELDIRSIRGIQYPHPDAELRWVVAPRSELRLLELPLLQDGSSPYLEYGLRYLAGDPTASHLPPGPYRAPFAVSTEHAITQAYPEVATHTSRDSYFAVDIAMPIGTDIFAARGGIVFDVASTNFRGGLDPVRDGPNANVIRILHDDGTYAIYAHLNTNSIRVRPGDVVRRGDYIADSGNTGYSSGPHLHFSVVRNTGMAIESVPVTFVGRNAQGVVPASGAILAAH